MIYGLLLGITIFGTVKSLAPKISPWRGMAASLFLLAAIYCGVQIGALP